MNLMHIQLTAPPPTGLPALLTIRLDKFEIHRLENVRMHVCAVCTRMNDA